MRHVITSAFLVSLPLMVLGCAGDSPLALAENAQPQLLQMGREPLGMVSGQVTCCAGLFNFNIQVRRVPNGNGVGVIEWSIPSGAGGAQLLFSERITCVEIDGNLAWVNTVIIKSFLPKGTPGLWAFREGPDGLQAQWVTNADGSPLSLCTDKPDVTDPNIFDAINFAPTTGGLTISG